MSGPVKALTVRDFIGLYNIDQTLFQVLPEFNFIESLAVRAKQNGCMCGLNDDLNKAILTYNDFINSLTPDVLERVKQKFGLGQACFVIQTADSYAVRCYD
jgi:hypothetical protein